MVLITALIFCAALGGEQFPLTSPTMMLALLDFKFPHS